MTVISYRKRVIKGIKRRRFIPRKRLFKMKSLYPRRTIYIHKGRFVLFKHRDTRKRFLKRFNTSILPRGMGADKSKSRSYSQSYTPKKPKTPESFDHSKIVDKWKKQWNKKKRSLATGRIKYPGEFGPGYAPRTDPKFKESFKREEKKGFGKKGFGKKEPTKEFKKVIDRKSFDTSKYRVYTDYGPVGEKGPKLLFEVTPTPQFYFYYKRRKLSAADDISTVLKFTRQAMQKMLDGLKIYADYIINKYVPKDSGDLRKAMIKSIKNAKVTNFSIKVVLDTKGIDYASPVNEMPTNMLRHDRLGKKGRKGRSKKTGKILHDPKAGKGWWEHIDMQLNTRAKDLLKTMIDDIVIAWIYNRPPTGFVHPPVGTQAITVESEEAYRRRLKLYGSWKKLHKKGSTPSERAKLKAGWYEGIIPRHTQEKQVPLRDNDWEVTRFSKMRERQYVKRKSVAVTGILYGPKPLSKKAGVVIKYDRSLIKGMFKISGLNRR